MPQVAIIGAGNVGASVAFALILNQVSADIVLYDIDTNKANAQVMDLADASFIHNAKITTATGQTAGQSDIIVITAGAKQLPNEPRTALISRNKQVLQSCISAMNPLNPNAIMIIVSNPVDILTSMAQQMSGLPKHQVFGTGTLLDSVRLRLALSHHLNISQTSINVSVFGEHGDSQFASYSTASIDNIPLLSYPGIAELDLTDIALQTKQKAYKIIEQKGHFYLTQAQRALALAALLA
jgi:L-lactate dehydrogenase